MANRSKIKGTQFETDIVRYLQDHGHPFAERRALAGALDKGDITGLPGVMIEAKNCATITLAAWADEVEAETRNAGASVGVAWIKRRGKGVDKSYIVMSPATFLELLG